MKIYTKTGDDGNTGLQGNLRIAKSHPRIISYGTVDEANAIFENMRVALINTKEREKELEDSKKEGKGL